MNANTGAGPQGQKPGGRPGAMTMAMQAVQIKPTGPKVLRIGIIQGGKIVEEKIVRTRETVTVGSSERNHFVIAAPNLPPRFEIFQLVGSDYILNFTESMTGRVGLPAGVQDLAQLRSSGAARNAGSHFQVKLNDSSRGKVVVGDTTILFQFVSPPPVQPRPQLPAAVRGGFAKSIDWMFTAFVAFSFMSHFGFVVYLENADWEIEQGVSAIPEKYAKLIFQEPEPPEPPEETEVDESAEDAAEEEVAEVERPAPQQEQAEAPAPEAPKSEEAKKEVAEATARMVEEASSAAEAMLLGALGSEGGGALADVLKEGAVTGNAEDVLAQAAGVGVASESAGGTLRTRSGGGSGERTQGLGSLAATKGSAKGVKEGSEVKEKAIKGNVRASGGGDIGGAGDFDVSKVTQMVKMRLRAIQLCYEKELRRNPALKGKVVVEFTIVERGNVSKATATDNTTGDAAVASCVVNVIKRFRFNPGPEGGAVTYSYPFVFAPQS